MAPTRAVPPLRRPVGSVVVLAVAMALAGCGMASTAVTVTPAPMAPSAAEGPAGSDDAGPAADAGPVGDAAWWRMRYDPVLAIEVGTLDSGRVATVQLVQQRVNPGT